MYPAFYFPTYQPDYLRLQPPSGSRLRVSSQELVNTLKPILSNHSNSSKFICGDFNMPDIDWDSALASSVDYADTLDCLLNAGLEQVVDFATHSSGNTLDLCFTDMSLKSIPCKRVVDFSDHIGVIANLKIENLVTAVNENTTNISLKVKNFHAAIEDISSSLFSLILPTSHPNYVTHWLQYFHTVIDSHCTESRIKRAKYPYFYSSHTIHSLNKLHTAERRLRKQFSKYEDGNVTRLRKAASESIELDTVIFTQTFTARNAKTSDCYAFIKAINQTSHIPKSMVLEDSTFRCNYSIATASNNHFSNVFNRSVGIFTDFSPGDFNDVVFGFEEVNAALKLASLGTGLESIPGLFLRENADNLTFHVYKLFAGIVDSCEYPSQWKDSYVTPIFKSGSKMDISCYRPISILSKPSLIFERVLYNKLYSFVADRLTHRQFGFTRKRSCQSQLLLYLHDIHKSLDENSESFAVYLDFCKAFDKVPHHVLLQKLRNFGVGGNLLRLLSSYLKHRRQCVKINGVLSGFLFADDSKSRAHSLRLLQADVDRCVEWAAKNGMTFNTKKTVFAHFANKHTLPTPHFLKLGDHIVPDSTTVKDLGLIVDNTLNWKSHITAKIKSCYNIFYSLRRVIPFSTPLATKVQVIKAYILSSLCYCSPIWYPSRTELKSMETLLSRVTKWIKVCSYSERLQKCFLMPITGISIQYQYIELNINIFHSISISISNRMKFQYQYQYQYLKAQYLNIITILRYQRPNSILNFEIYN